MRRETVHIARQAVAKAVARMCWSITAVREMRRCCRGSPRCYGAKDPWAARFTTEIADIVARVITLFIPSQLQD